MSPRLTVGEMEPTSSGALDPADSASEGLQVRCSGHFEVLRNGHVVNDWRRDKAKSLLKHLIAHDGSVKRDVLADLLWPELDADQAVRNLRVALHALRRAIESGAEGNQTAYVLTRGDAYELNPRTRIWVDTQAFSGLYALGATLWRRGGIEESLRTYEAVEALYRDDYLLDDLYEEWTFVRREQLKDQYLLVLMRLADSALKRKDYEGCIGYCHKILDRDASREDAYQRLMRCHAQMGRPGRALRWFELCRETLRRDLNVAPGEHTLQLAEQIALGGSADWAESDTPPQDHIRLMSA
jgi:LuxR family transcriptional regulator, maltose regulon positive regulatory protein